MQLQPVTLDGSSLMSKEISIIGAQGYPTEFPEVMDKLSTHTVDPEAMITHRFPFTDFLHAFEVANDANSAAKVVLTLTEWREACWRQHFAALILGCKPPIVDARWLLLLTTS